MNANELKLKDFSYDLPQNLVAQTPTQHRSDSLLLTYGGPGKIAKTAFKDLIKQLPENSLLIFNNTKVIPGRLLGKLESGGKFECFLLENTDRDKNVWRCLGRPLKKIRPGKNLHFGENLCGVVTQKDEESFCLAFNIDFAEFENWLNNNAFIPLPPYIKRDDPKVASASEDRERYQTVYAAVSGSVAAPTAGLHFTEEILEQAKSAHHTIGNVCLHVGAGTFLPVKTQEVAEHRMHAESYYIPAETLELIKNQQRLKRPIIAVGTTSFRAVESFFGQEQLTSDTWHETSLFIHPKFKNDRYTPRVFTHMITNFHQPESTLFMLICALIGYENAKEAYAFAIENNFRFFSYGDSSLLKLG